jgi:hypothetical protein
MRYSALKSVLGAACIAACFVTIACKEDASEPHDGVAGTAGATSGAGGKAGAAAGGKAGRGGQASGGSGGSSPAVNGGEGGGAGQTPTAGGAAGESGGEGGVASGSGGAGGEISAGEAGQGGEGGESNSLCGTGDVIADPATCEDTFTITVTCVTGPCAQPTYVHTYNVTWVGHEFTGVGTAESAGTEYEQDICGAVADGTLTFHVVYTSIVPGYTIDGTAAVAEDGTASGTGSGHDPRGADQTFTLEVSTLNLDCN